MANMLDVAKLADVSPATVSRVLTNPDIVSDHTKDKVLKAIEELNYKPNVLARNLRKMENKNILVILPDITNTFFSQVLRGIDQVASENGYRVLLADTKDKLDLEHEYLTYLDLKIADAAIMLTSRNIEAIEELAQKHQIVLACEYIKDSQLPMVSIDNVKSAYKATKHLIDLGHQKIAHISGPMDIILNKDRFEGYKKALHDANIEFNGNWVKEGKYTVNSGYSEMKKLLQLSNPPTAVFASNDEMAIGAIKAIKNSNMKVPDDIAVVGFDDIKWASIYEPALTTIFQPTFEIGKKAMLILLKLIKEEKKDFQLERKVYEGELVVRKTCGAKNNHD